MARVRAPIVAFVTLIASASFTLAACSDSSPESERAGEIYGAVIRALVPAEPDTTKVTREVFIGGGADPVALDVQSDVLQELDEYERLRFVDDRSEAVDDEPPFPVHNAGVYLEIGRVPESGTRVTVDTLRYLSDQDQEQLRLHLTRASGRWTVSDIVER